jgi:hypothetical protein
MSHARVTTRPGAYADSVRLMQVSQLIGSADGVEGVEAALVAMATDLNLDLAREMGFTVSDATADDLLIAVRATKAAALDAAIDLAELRLAARPLPQEPGGVEGGPARTVRSVACQAGPALALISVPGPHAFTEAMDALDAGCDMLVFSDNVPVDHEVRLKEVAANGADWSWGRTAFKPEPAPPLHRCTSRWSGRAIPTWRPQLGMSFTPSASIRRVGPSGPGGRRRRHGGRRRRGEPSRPVPPAASRRAA